MHKRIGCALAAVVASAAWLLWPWDAAPPRDAAAAQTPPLAASPVAAADSGETVAGRLEVRSASMLPGDPDLGEVPAWTARIRVLDDLDAPVEGATVEVWAGEHQARPLAEDPTGPVVWLGRAAGPPLLVATTGADGNCDLGVARQRVYVAARHPGFGQSVVHGVDGDRLPRDRVVRMWLGRPVLVRGQVIDAHGWPVPFARVDVQPDRSRFNDKPKARCSTTGTLAADSCGRFRFEAAVGAPLRVRAASRGVDSLTACVTAAAGIEVVVAFAGGIRITGRAVDEHGAPWADAIVRFRPTELVAAQGLEPDASVRTQPDGSFALAVPTFGSYTLDAEDPRSSTRADALEVAVTAVQPQAQVELRLLRPVPIRGCVRRPDGEPAADVIVAAEPAGRAAEVWSGASVNPRVRSGADGRFELPVPPQRRYELFAKDEDGEGASADVAAGAVDVEIVLRPRTDRVRLRGEVVNDADGQPVQDYALHWVKLRDGSGQPAWVSQMARDSRTGHRFDVAEIPTGDGWRLLALGAGGKTAAAITDPFAAGRSEPRLVLRLRPQVPLTVRVVDGQGQGLRHLGVTVLAAAPVVARGIGTASATTDDQGCVRFEALVGRVTVVVRRSFEELARREVVLAPGANAEVVIPVSL